MKRFLWATAVICLVVAPATATDAAVPKPLRIGPLNPNTGKIGTIFSIEVHEIVKEKYEQLELTITSTAGGKCATDYAKGFATQFGLAGRNGKPMPQKYEATGKHSKSVIAKITSGDPGKYGICAYLVLGSKTKAHAASSFTITQ